MVKNGGRVNGEVRFGSERPDNIIEQFTKEINMGRGKFD